MIYFICWVVFIVVLILSVIVAQLMGGRGSRPERSRSLATDPHFDEDGVLEEADESLEEGEAVESFEEYPAEGFAAEGEQPTDDFAAFDEEFK